MYGKLIDLSSLTPVVRFRHFSFEQRRLLLDAFAESGCLSDDFSSADFSSFLHFCTVPPTIFAVDLELQTIALLVQLLLVQLLYEIFGQVDVQPDLLAVAAFRFLAQANGGQLGRLTIVQVAQPERLIFQLPFEMVQLAEAQVRAEHLAIGDVEHLVRLQADRSAVVRLSRRSSRHDR